MNILDQFLLGLHFIVAISAGLIVASAWMIKTRQYKERYLFATIAIIVAFVTFCVVAVFNTLAAAYPLTAFIIDMALLVVGIYILQKRRTERAAKRKLEKEKETARLKAAEEKKARRYSSKNTYRNKYGSNIPARKKGSPSYSNADFYW